MIQHTTGAGQGGPRRQRAELRQHEQLAREPRPIVVQTISSVGWHEGGPPNTALRLNAAFRRDGADARLVTFGSSDEGDPELMREANVTWLPRSRPHSLGNCWRLLPWCLRLRGRIGFVHVHGLYRANSAYAWLLNCFWGVPYSVQPHGSLEPYQARTRAIRKRAWDAVIGHRILRSARAVVVASQSEAERLPPQVARERVVIAPPGVPGPTKGEAPDGIDRWLGTEGLRVVFVGRFAAKKQPDLLIRAWARACEGGLKGQLLLAGHDGDFTAAALRSMAADIGHGASVTVVGGVTGAQRDFVLGQADVLALVSENENFGQVVTEALAAGCLVITTEAVASAALVLEAGSGTVLRSPASVDDVTAALQRVPALKAAGAGSDGPALVRRMLSWRAMASSIARAHGYELDECGPVAPDAAAHRIASTPVRQDLGGPGP